MKNDCICAISTPIGVGGISIIRLSGDNSLNIAKKICEKTDFGKEPRKMFLTKVFARNFTELALVVYFAAPHTYTGEDIVEFQCHGGIVIANGILQTLIENGARLAENGEFTKRAFLNGKISLDASEGVIDMINAESEAEVRAGFNLLSGKLQEKIKSIQNILTDCFAKIEVALDYPEHDIEYSTAEDVNFQIQDAKKQVENLLSTVYAGRIVKHGINVAIFGKTNVGKSSLLNAIIGNDRAIVTEIAGTTRDTLQENITINGVKVNFVDTAGLRETNDTVEKIGVERAKQTVNNCDVVLAVFDAKQKISLEHILPFKNKKIIVVANKVDLLDKNECEKFVQSLKNEFEKQNIEFCNVMKVSAKNLDGIEELKQYIYNLVIDKNIANNSTIITNQRQEQSLKATAEHITKCEKSIKDGLGLELINIDLVDAWNSIGEITGDTNAQERIDAIFQKFCLGK